MKLAWVVTPQPGLGELIGEALAALRIDAIVQHNASPEVLVEGRQVFDLLVLDGDTAPPEVLTALVARWRALAPEGRLICIRPENATTQWQENLRADHWLNKPFYLPDLTDAIKRLLNLNAPIAPPHTPDTPPPNALPPWLADVTLAAQHLARLSLETAAQAAALVSREGTLWAYAGGLPRLAAEELARLAAHHWEADGGGDFVRFVRLEVVQQDFLLYATPVAAELMLVMVFEASTPFTRIRAQANRLAEALTRQAPDESAMHAQKTVPLPPPEAPEEDETPIEESAPALEDIDEDEDEDEVDAAATSEDFEEALPPEASLPLFDEVPPPVPDIGIQDAPFMNEGPAEAPTVAVNVPPALTPTGPRGYAAPSDPTIPVAIARQIADANASQAVSASTATLPPPATFARAELFYACVLIPRFPQDHLTGDLAHDLGQWMPRIVTSLGWRLVHLAVRPNYLQWIVQVLPAVSPADILRLVRQHTSRHIFSNYPRIAAHHMGNDFWAPGYLVLGRNKPVPAATIEAFIRQIRRRQGLTP